MDPTSESRLVRNAIYPKIVYLEALTLFLGANFLFHQNVYRVSQNRPHFLAFILVSTSSAPLFVGYVAPASAVFSRGCDNRYGHPHPDVTSLFKRFEIPTFDTCEDGTVTFVSDGNIVRLR